MVNISMRKMILSQKSMIFEILKMFRRINYFIPRWSYDIYFALKIRKKYRFINISIFETKKLTFNFIVNRDWKKLTDSRKKSQHFSR